MGLPQAKLLVRLQAPNEPANIAWLVEGAELIGMKFAKVALEQTVPLFLDQAKDRGVAGDGVKHTIGYDFHMKYNFNIYNLLSTEF